MGNGWKSPFPTLFKVDVSGTWRIIPLRKSLGSSPWISAINFRHLQKKKNTTRSLGDKNSPRLFSPLPASSTFLGKPLQQPKATDSAFGQQSPSCFTRHSCSGQVRLGRLGGSLGKTIRRLLYSKKDTTHIQHTPTSHTHSAIPLRQL